MKKTYLCMLVLVLATACEKVDPGEPPADAVFSATGLSESQLQVSWNPGEDDLLEPANLAFAIWIASGDEVIDAESSPTQTTEEGALSYTFTGLEAETTYDVLVRTQDRFGDRSNNETTRSAATTAPASGRFIAERGVTLDGTANGMVVGKVFGIGTDDLGVVFGSNLRWFRVNENLDYTPNNQEVTHNEPILEAYLVQTEEAVFAHELFILSSSGLSYYERTGDSFDQPMAPFQGQPRQGTADFLHKDGFLELVTFVDTNGIGAIYTNQIGVEDAQGPFNQENTFNLGDQDASFKLGHFDGDEFHDRVSLVGNEVRIALGLEDFQFESETVMDTIEDDQLGPGPFDGGEMTHSLFVDQKKVFIFFRNATEDVTKLFIYQADEDGDFGDPVIADYGHHFYEMPSFQMNDAGTYDFIAPQTSSNNVAIYSASGNYAGTPQYYGALGKPDQALYADVDGRSGLDLLVLTSEANMITVLLGN